MSSMCILYFDDFISCGRALYVFIYPSYRVVLTSLSINQSTIYQTVYVLSNYCPEHISCNSLQPYHTKSLRPLSHPMGFIDTDQARALADGLVKSGYGAYIHAQLDQGLS